MSEQTSGKPAAAPASGEPSATDTPAGGQSTDTHWIDSVPAGTFDDRSTTILKRFNTVPDLAKGYMNAFNLVSRDKIPMPQNDQEFQEVYNRLGRPEDHAQYELSVNPEYPETFHKQMEGNQDWFKQIAHKIGLNKTQARQLYGEYTDLVHKQQTASNDRIQGEMIQATTELKNEYGPSFDGKMVLANRAIDQVGGQSLIKLLEDSGLGRHPTMVKAFIKIGEMLGEESGIDLGDTQESNENLDAEIAKIQSDPAYLDAKDPQHNILVAKMQKLMIKRHPEERLPAGTIRLF